MKICVSILVLAVALAPGASARQASPDYPDILIICVDTLRADRLSSYGYKRPISPEIDGLLDRGTIFLQARTVEPLTGPASASMITSRFPHEHGATRNGLKIRPGLQSLPRLLAGHGYETAAFIGNWTLRDRLTGLSEHFDLYQEVFSRKRWFGLFNSEATGEDLTSELLAWVDEHEQSRPERPFFAWVQFVEPHAPYRYWEEFGRRLQLGTEAFGGLGKRDRYDSEVAFVDREVGRLLRGLSDSDEPLQDTLVVFVSDHGESLGDHGYWGHGRYVYESSLQIPMGIVWPDRVPAQRLRHPALNIDLAPTVLGLLGMHHPEVFRGFDWSPVLRGGAEPPLRATYFQAHKGTVQAAHTSMTARSEGLLEVGRVSGQLKEVLDVRNRTVRIYDMARDPGEVKNLASPGTRPSREILTWYEGVRAGLRAASDLPLAELDARGLKHLRALGYVD